jgi:hypothetical protein
MTRPSIDEHDTGSYLDASIAAHEVIAVTEFGVNVDGSPDLDFDGLYDPEALCKEHAFTHARSCGFLGPVAIPVTYQRAMPYEVEQAMLKFDENGTLTHIASYAYGRAYFAPGEPRTALCDVCGVETLIDGFV